MGGACAEDAPNASWRKSAVIYGEDDRVDPFAHPDPTLRALATESVAGMVDRRALSVEAGAVRVRGSTHPVRMRIRIIVSYVPDIAAATASTSSRRPPGFTSPP